MYTARRATGTRPRRRFVALPLVLLAALAAILPATADDMQNGWLSVSIEPAIGAAISVDGVVRNTGAISRLELPPGDHWVDFGQVDGFMPPAPQQVRVARNETTELQVEYQPAGVLDVTVTPDGIDPLVSVDGVPRDIMGTTITAATGETTICGEPVTGYLSPGCQTVEVSTGVTTRVRLAYQSTPTDDEVVEGGPRVAEGLVGLYEFDDGSDDKITDTAGVVDGMDLTIADPSATTWGQGMLTFDQPTIATTGGAPTGLYERVRTTGEFTVEAWIEPADLTQNGPARLVSLGKDTSTANVVVGQGSYQGAGDLIEARHQRIGDYQLPTAEGTLTTDLTHVVVTRAGDGTVTVYIDGQKQASRTLDGDPANWDTSHRLALGAELDKSRHWLGTYHLVALYDTALTPDQITTNHTAGPTADTPQADPEPDPQPAPETETDDPVVEGREEDLAVTPSSWQAAWDSRDYDTLRAWYRENTGIAAAGLTESDLTPSGSVTSTHDGQVIEGLLVSGGIQVRHNDVVIRNTKVVGDSIGIDVPYNARNSVERFYVENVSLIGTGPTSESAAGRGISGTYATVHATSVYISNRGAGIRLGNSGGDTVNLSMIENIRHVPPAHNTGISYRGGSGVRLTRNWIEGSSSSALSLYPDAAPITDHLSRENLFDGGTYSVRGGTDKTYRDELADIRFVDNRFTRNHQYGARAAWCGSCPGNQWTGNNYLDDGTPAS